MTIQVREQVHRAVDQLPETQLPEVLRLMELLATAPVDADVEIEETWLLASGTLKQLVDATDNAPAPVADWRKHLHDL